MENNPFDHRELHDFLNVESFSQLPFIRTATSHKEKGFRLFGKEFGGGETPAAVTITGLDESYATAAVASEDAKEICNDNNNGEENTRKFECQYCCRNFPTSQALGGHQNAHKRERQHAKRAQLQSAMMHAGGLAERALLPAHMYGPMNYHRLGGGFASAPSLAYHHDNWNKNSSAYTSSSRLYDSTGGGGGSKYSQPPINGSSLALWQIPSAHSSRIFNRSEGGSMHQRPLLGNPEFNNPQVIKSAVSQLRLGYDQSKPKLIDPVSLDLHL